MTRAPRTSLLNAESLLFSLLLLILVTSGTVVYALVCNALHPGIPLFTLGVRGTAFLAVFLLQLLVCAAPLSQLHRGFGPLYHHRDQLMVATLFFSATHAGLILVQHHGQGDTFPLLSLFSSYSNEFGRLLSGRGNLRDFPFEPLGAFALVVLLVAVLSRCIGPWSGKGLNALIYPAYAAVLVHVALGLLQSEPHPIYITLLLAGLLAFLGLHLFGAFQASSPENDVRVSLAPEASPEEETAAGDSPPAPMAEIQALLTSARLYVLFTCPLYMALLGAAQPNAEGGHYAPSPVTEIEGTYYASPLPSLYVSPEWSVEPREGWPVLLCGTGKFSIPAEWSEADGKRVRLRGHFLNRGTVTMLEVSSGETPEILGEPESPQVRPEEATGEPVTLAGELVSMKCYLGYMWPATGKVHRACAIRCLAGGVSPGLLVGSGSSAEVLVLTAPAGKVLELDETLGGVEVSVKGKLFQQRGFSYVRAESVTRYESP